MSRCALSNRFISCLMLIVSLVVFFSVFLTSATVAAQDLKTVELSAELQQIRAQLERSVREEKRRERERVLQVGAKAASPPVNEADSLALVKLFNSTAGASWNNKTNWLTGRVDTWFGITVVGDRVTRVRLAGNNLIGTIPTELGDLTALTSLDLGVDIFGSGENKLSGSIPSGLGNLTELTSVWLGGNELTGSIPSSIGNLSKLETLDFGNFFGGNMLTGSIPSSFGNLTNLQNLWLSNNQLSGPIPASLGNLSALGNLDLGGNMLTGSIPSELGNLTDLSFLILGTVFGGNQLTGIIPTSLGNLQNLVFLSLDRNQLEGTIPSVLGQLPMLESLSLMGNRLSGSIPPELGNLPNLVSLNLGMNTVVLDNDGNILPLSLSNLLSGEIPSQLGNLTKMGSLLFSNNAFSGAVPPSFANLNLLRTLMLNCNQLEGLPSFSSIPDLSALFVEKNRLTFEDIEPNIGVATTAYTYSPQTSVPVTVAPAGSDLVLSVAEIGANNQYQWFLHGSPIAGANQSSYTISTSDSNGIAAYHVEITNSVAADLTLSSLPTYSDIIVNDAGDASDAKLADGLCDTDLQAPGLQCTLRAALQTLAQGNALTCGTDAVQIKFEGVQLIQPNSPLPTITKSVLINGDMGGTRVEIRGGSAGQTNGFDIEGQDVTLRSLRINAFSGWGVLIIGGSGHRIEDSRIGVLSDEMTNLSGGVRVDNGATEVTIGGFLASQENVIGGGVQVAGAQTNGIRVLRNVLEITESDLSTGNLRVPIDLNADGPTCSAWNTARPGTPNMEVPPPRVLELTSTSLHGAAQSGATVVVYRVVASGTDRGRYWARSVLPIGVGIADATGMFDVVFDFAQEPGTQITLSMTDSAGNTSELSQVRRPVVYLPGVGGSWLEAENGDNLFIPTPTSNEKINRLLRRLAMDETGTNSLSGEQVNVDGILEEGVGSKELPYRAVLQHLQTAGFVGRAGNTDEATLDLWRFPYDWRRGPETIADKLLALVDHITNNQPSDQTAAACEVDIATHSNGGMVASAYVWKPGMHSQNHVNRLFMSAAPYLGTPQVAAAHTKGYLFEIEKKLNADFDWGALVNVFLNLPDGYSLLPSRQYMDVIDPNADLQADWYLTDLYGNHLKDYQETFDFMTAPKINPADMKPLGLARNGTMWTKQQTDLHAFINDWRSYNRPPQVFRHIGRIKNSTALGWDTGSLFSAANVVNSTRKEVGDTDVHIAYRESLQPKLGWGDGTVALVSATLGGGVTHEGGAIIGLADLSGQSSVWIEKFDYFECDHVTMVATSCNGDSGNALDETVRILKSSYEVSAPPTGKTASNLFAASEREVFYVEASSAIAVTVEDDTGARTGPIDGKPLNEIEYEVPGIGYWPSQSGAVLSVPSDNAFTITIEATGGEALVRVNRGMTEGDQVRNILFPDQTLADGGRLRFVFASGGTSADAAFDMDVDGNGVFESTLAPATQMLSTEPGPSIPNPTPFRIQQDINQADADPVVSFSIPDVGGPMWNWTLEDIPAWIHPDSEAGAIPATVGLTLSASTLSAGVHRDTIQVALTIDGFTIRSQVSVELAIRDQAAVLTEITVHPTGGALVPGDSLQFWALGKDQLALPINVVPNWTATGGSISDSGTYIAGSSTGVFTVMASNGGGTISGSVQVEIIGGVATEEEETLPTSFALDQNYPNPFNPVTTIRFALPSQEHVRLVVYDLLGREISVLIDDLRLVGHHRTEFGNARIPSGVYFYRLTAGSFQQTKKMLLLR